MLVVCAGTATDVGKTWIGAAVLGHLRAAGIPVMARKPVQSYDVGPTDADVLAGATGEGAHEVCPADRWYAVPMAPPMAADVLGLPAPRLADLVASLPPAPRAPGMLWVESVGGVRSPVADDGDTVDLCDALRPDLVVLVADAGLGTINAVLTSIAPLDGHTVIVLLNRYDRGNDLHARNRAWLTSRSGVDIEVSAVELATRIGQPGDRSRRRSRL